MPIIFYFIVHLFFLFPFNGIGLVVGTRDDTNHEYLRNFDIFPKGVLFHI